MRRVHGASIIVFVCLTLALALAVGVAGGISPTENTASPEQYASIAGGAVDSDSETQTESELSEQQPHVAAVGGANNIQQTLQIDRTPDRVGEITITLEYTIPDQVTRLSVRLPTQATDVETSGFSDAGDRRFAWDGNRNTPTITYRVPSDRTTESRGPIGDDGRFLFTETDEWALIGVNQPGLEWGWRGPARVSVDRERTIAGEGATGGVIAFLGPHTEYQRTAHGQTFRLIVPDAATLEETPEDILDALEFASDALGVGDRDSEVFVVAAPEDGTPWGVRGLQTGAADMWVNAEEPLSDPSNVWLHEYVHTRQGFAVTDETEWFLEGGATYYAARLTLEREDTDFRSFQRELARGERSPQADSTLSDPTTWSGAAEYRKGALVAGELDRQIRVEGDGQTALDTVFAALNAQDGPVTNDAFRAAIEREGGSSAVDAYDRYVFTSAVPTMWNRDAHEAAFGTVPAQIESSVSDTVDISGPYRQVTLDRRGTDPISVTTGETINISVGIENYGGTAGSYEIPVYVDGTAESTLNGTIEPDERVSEIVTRAFDDPGRYDIRIDDTQVTVVVQEPTQLSVSDISADSQTIETGESVTITATIQNPEAVPGRGEFPIRINGEARDTKIVHLDAGAETTVELTETFTESGTYTVQIGSGELTLTVLDPETETESLIPGFGFTPVVVALAVLFTMILFRSRSMRY